MTTPSSSTIPNHPKPLNPADASTTSDSKEKPPSPLEMYLANLEKRDKREKQYEKYINAFTKLADKTAAAEKARLIAEHEAYQSIVAEAKEPSTSDAKARPPLRYWPSSGGRSSPAPPAPVAEPPSIAQIRANLAATNKLRLEQEARIATLITENSTYKTTTAEQSRRIEGLEKKTRSLERKLKDTIEEAEGRKKIADEAQDEVLVLQMETNAYKKKYEEVVADRDELTQRWMAAKAEESRKMNEEMEKGLRR